MPGAFSDLIANLICISKVLSSFIEMHRRKQHTTAVKVYTTALPPQYKKLVRKYHPPPLSEVFQCYTYIQYRRQTTIPKLHQMTHEKLSFVLPPPPVCTHAYLACLLACRRHRHLFSQPTTVICGSPKPTAHILKMKNSAALCGS